MKNRLVNKLLRWVKATVITVSMGSVGAVYLQPNMLFTHNKRLNKGRKKLDLRHFVPNFSQAFCAC